MSVNTAHANGGVLIFNGEVIVLYCDGVELHIDGEDAKDFRGNKKGRVYLTSHRMIFVNKGEKDPLQSFSFPFFTLKSINLEQPIFGANFIKGVVTAQPGGNFNGKADFKLKFNTGGAIEFGQAMLQAAKMASRYMPPQPPPYMPAQGPYYPAPPPAYTFPAEGYQGFVPPMHVFPNAPPANSVFTSDMPPPYPGIYAPGQGPNPYPQGQPQQQAPPPGYPQGQPQQQAPPPGYPQGQAPPPGYPTAGAPGYAGGPPPMGFNTSASGMPPNAPMYNGAQAPNAPMYNGAQAPNAPMYNGAQAPNAPMYNGAPPMPAYNYSGAGMKPTGNAPCMYQDPNNPNTMYVYQNSANNFQEPPPPYTDAHKKEQ